MHEWMTNAWLWTVLLGGLLFLPTRKLLWVMAVRRLERRTGQPAGDEVRLALKRRTSVTAALLVFVFSVVYVQVMLANIHGRT